MASRYAVFGMMRMLPDFKGKMRIGRLALSALGDQTDVEVSTHWGHRIILPGLRESMSQQLLFNGRYETDTIAGFTKAIKPGMTVLDVGANIGYFTALASKLVGDQGRVIAIEASPRMFGYLSRNIERNGLRNVTAIHTAATAADGADVEFFEASGDHFGMGSLARNERSAAAAPIRVRGRRVDSILSELGSTRIDFVKVDVEGFEAGVFEGMGETLVRGGIGSIIFEFIDVHERNAGFAAGTAQRTLLDRGFVLCTLDDYLAGKPPGRNVLEAGSLNLVALPGGQS